MNKPKLVNVDGRWVKIPWNEPHPNLSKAITQNQDREIVVRERGKRREKRAEEEAKPKNCGNCKYMTFYGPHEATLQHGSCNRHWLSKRPYNAASAEPCGEYRRMPAHKLVFIRLNAEKLSERLGNIRPGRRKVVH